jgi:hypothetical protein
LLQTQSDLFALVTKTSPKNTGTYQLIRFYTSKVVLSKATLPGNNYYTAEVHDGIIYLLTSGALYRYDQKADRFSTIVSDSSLGWNRVYDTDMMLKSGRYLLTRVRDRRLLIDEMDGSITDFTLGTVSEKPNRFDFGERYAWATQRAFYVLEKSSGVPVFTQFSPATKQTKAIPMPEIDNASFQRSEPSFSSTTAFYF